MSPVISLRATLRNALASITSPLGATYLELLEATGFDAAKLSRVVTALSNAKQIHMIMRGRHTRYFATPEARDAAITEVNALVDAVIAQARARNDARKAERYRERVKDRPTKPARASKPLKKVTPWREKPCMPANVTIKARPTAVSFRHQEAIIPPGVKKQVFPHGVDTRHTFKPPPGWVGELEAQWRTLRGDGATNGRKSKGSS